MPGFGDYIFIFVLALILFGPKKMPELARQLGKLMGEFRRASNEFKMQMEEEMRTSERAEQEKKVAALEAAAPAPAMLSSDTDAALPAPEIEEVPIIATAGELTMHPPETGVPVQNNFGSDPKLDAVLSQNTMPATEPAQTSPADAVNALADSIPAAEGHTTHG